MFGIGRVLGPGLQGAGDAALEEDGQDDPEVRVDADVLEQVEEQRLLPVRRYVRHGGREHPQDLDERHVRVRLGRRLKSCKPKQERKNFIVITKQGATKYLMIKKKNT